MSNLSDIGFPVKSDKDVNQIIMDVLPHLVADPCPPHGFYYKFEDKSGAQIYLQANATQELIGFNPSFLGESRRRVRLVKAIARDTSELDGAFHVWANPGNETDEVDSGDYPFVFDVPNFRSVDGIELPENTEVQLTAFASNDFQIFAQENEFHNSQQNVPKVATKSFIPSGLFTIDKKGESVEVDPPQAHAILTAEIKIFKLKTNKFTSKDFYWFLVETHGGEIDVVADVNLVKEKPQIGGILRGSFWLSGKILSNLSQT